MPAALQQECLGHIGDMEAAMVKEFPFEVPSEFKDLPQLKVCSCYGLTGHSGGMSWTGHRHRTRPVHLLARVCSPASSSWAVMHGRARVQPACISLAPAHRAAHQQGTGEAGPWQCVHASPTAT